MASMSREGRVRMPTAVSFALGSVGVAASLWLAWMALTNDSVPIVGSVRGALIAVVIIGMAACSVAGIGLAPDIGRTHPITIFGIVVGLLALAIAGAGLFGWDGLVRFADGLLPLGTGLTATTERLAIGLLAGLIALKWVAGIPLALLVNRG